jgi:hypothetical protein
MKRKLAVAVVALLAALAAAELVARLAFGDRVAQIYQLDPRCLHRLVPGSHKLFVHHANNGGAAIPIEVDRDGYRGEDLGPRDEALRVAVFGDSCVMAEFSRLEHTYCERLERALAGSLGRTVEVVNAGVVAYGPDQVLVRMEDDLQALAPDLAVVVVFTENDFGDLVRNKLFRLDGAGALAVNPFVIGSLLEAKFEEGTRTPALWRLARRAWRAQRTEDAVAALTAGTAEGRRAAAVDLVEGWLRQCEAEWNRDVLAGDREVRALFEDHYDADVALDPRGAAATYKVALMAAVLGRMAGVASSHSVPLAVVVVPSPIDACDAWEGGVVDRRAHPDYDPVRPTTAAADAARRHGIPCLDLYAPFRAGGASLYFRPPDNHWNDAGQALAAERTRDFVLAEQLLRDRREGR